ncbi:NADH dehydrogenase [ubiquinone] 1 alpha subcomplex subunit 8 [Ditylenchus destructor]|nr:NADH dehydrogenase [ubiquinone] 1 alpha subcomplex subunit 8 [Ditylenchus destructor]
MAVTNTTPMPTDEELTVPQEITLSTPWFKAVAPYMYKKCETDIKEFMLLRSEYEDPRKTLKEGARVTACGVDFLRKVKKSCKEEVANYAHCIDTAHHKLYVSRCREQQRYVDQCIEDKLGVVRPPLGYFSKLHVHESDVPKHEHKMRDYKAEAAKVMSELPKDYVFRKDYKRFDQFALSPVDR